MTIQSDIDDNVITKTPTIIFNHANFTNHNLYVSWKSYYDQSHSRIRLTYTNGTEISDTNWILNSDKDTHIFQIIEATPTTIATICNPIHSDINDNNTANYLVKLSIKDKYENISPEITMNVNSHNNIIYSYVNLFSTTLLESNSFIFSNNEIVNELITLRLINDTKYNIYYKFIICY
jgi:hypothetical protein